MLCLKALGLSLPASSQLQPGRSARSSSTPCDSKRRSLAPQQTDVCDFQPLVHDMSVVMVTGVLVQSGGRS